MTSSNGASGALVIGANVVYVEGPACRLHDVLTITLRGGRDHRALPVRGNPIVIPITAQLRRGGFAAGGGSYFWVNWCGHPPPFLIVAKASHATATTDLPVQSPACIDQRRPSRLEPFSNSGPTL